MESDLIQEEIIEEIIGETIPEEYKPKVRDVLNKIIDKFEEGGYHIVYKQNDKVLYLPAKNEDISIDVLDKEKVANKISDITPVLDTLKKI